MSEIIAFPTPEKPERRVRHSARHMHEMRDRLKIDHSEEVCDAKVHAVCGYLKTFEKSLVGDDRRRGGCRQCPRWEEDGHYGPVQRGCYGMAEEFTALAMYGHEYPQEREEP